MTDWLEVTPGDAPLIVSIPHAGTDIPEDIDGLRSSARARHDTDFHVERLYAFASDLGATSLRTRISRTVIDVNRDPSGARSTPGRRRPAFVRIRPSTVHHSTDRDGFLANMRSQGVEPCILIRTTTHSRRRSQGCARCTARLSSTTPIRFAASVPRLFAGELPFVNVGSFDGASCARILTDTIASLCPAGSHVVNGRFRGGWITRHYGNPANGIHAVQMELAMRGYLDETGRWPPAWESTRASPLQQTLRPILAACLAFALTPA